MQPVLFSNHTEAKVKQVKDGEAGGTSCHVNGRQRIDSQKLGMMQRGTCNVLKSKLLQVFRSSLLFRMKRQIQRTGDDAARLLRRFPLSTGAVRPNRFEGKERYEPPPPPIDISKRVRSTVHEEDEEEDDDEDLEVASIPSSRGMEEEAGDEEGEARRNQKRVDVDDKHERRGRVKKTVRTQQRESYDLSHRRRPQSSSRSSDQSRRLVSQQKMTRSDDDDSSSLSSSFSRLPPSSSGSYYLQKVDERRGEGGEGKKKKKEAIKQQQQHPQSRIPPLRNSEKGKVSQAMRALSKVLQHIEEDIDTAIELLSIMIPAKEADHEAHALAGAFNDQDQQILQEKIRELKTQRNEIRHELAQKQKLLDHNLLILREALHKRAVVLKAFNKDTNFFKRHPDVSHFFVEKQESMKAILAQFEERILNSSLDVVAAHMLRQQEIERQIISETHVEEEEGGDDEEEEEEI